MAWVTAVAQVPSLAQGPLHAAGVAKKKRGGEEKETEKPKKKKSEKNLYVLHTCIYFICFIMAAAMAYAAYG